MRDDFDNTAESLENYQSPDATQETTGEQKVYKPRACGSCFEPVDRDGVKCSDCMSPKSSKKARGIRNCRECGAEYSGRIRKFCSAFCRNTVNNRDKLQRAGTVSVEEKKCNKCGLVRRAVMFTYDASKIDGLHSTCRVCHAQKHEEWRNRPENRDAIRAGNLRRAFGISLQEYDALLAHQGGVCAFCRQPNRYSKRFAVEHDHATGAIRSLACWRCNKLKIGSLTLEDAARLVEYLSNPPADAFFGGKRLVPAQQPRRRRKKRWH